MPNVSPPPTGMSCPIEMKWTGRVRVVGTRFLVDRDRQGDRASGAHERRGLADRLGGDVVQGPELVVGPPPAPGPHRLEQPIELLNRRRAGLVNPLPLPCASCARNPERLSTPAEKRPSCTDTQGRPPTRGAGPAYCRSPGRTGCLQLTRRRARPDSVFEGLVRPGRSRQPSCRSSTSSAVVVLSSMISPAFSSQASLPRSLRTTRMATPISHPHADDQRRPVVGDAGNGLNDLTSE